MNHLQVIHVIYDTVKFLVQSTIALTHTIHSHASYQTKK